jgi:PAS domain S-box-containing protein
MDTNSTSSFAETNANNGIDQIQQQHHPELIDLLPVGFYTCDNQGYITSYNKAAVKLWGRTPAIGEDRWHSSSKIYNIKGEPISLDACPVARALKEGIAIEGEKNIILRADGTRVVVQVSVVPLFNHARVLTGVVNTMVAINELTQDEEKQARLAAIVDSSDDAIISKTLKGIITSWNKGAESIFGYTEAEVLNKHISILIPKARLSEEEYIIGQVAKGNRVEHFETIRLSKCGTETPVSLTVSPVKNNNGEIIGASKIARNISAQKNAQERLKRYADNLEIINSVIKTISEELDLNKILQKVTDSTTQLTGARFGAFFYNSVNTNGEALMLYTLSGAPKEAFENFGMPRHTAVFKPTFMGEGVIRVDDITKDARYGRNFPHTGMPAGHLSVVSYLAVPVVSRFGEVIGGLIFGHPKAGIFTQDHENMVISIAAQAAIGLDNAKLYEEIKELNEKKDDFIGMASHELKTPLTSISGYLQILQRLKGDENSKKFIAKTAQQVKKLSALVADLLDVSKVEAGKLQLSKENFDIGDVLNEAIELIQHSNTSHQISIEKSIDSITLFGDPQRIEQVVINLLSNAIKYSPSANKIQVFLTCTDSEVKVSVKDEGFGIPADMLTNIFSRFYRVDNISPAISGLGIGLYISHDIIERHNGKLWAESELGKGSTFWFTLPILR